ncbi:MAG: DUF488 family protein [Rhodoglobus sp.]
MWDSERGIIGIGYEGLTLESLADRLTAWGVTTLADVRLNAISRKRGFSKKALQAHLVAQGIRYIHMPELGNVRHNRAGFSDPGSTEGDAARVKFIERLAAPEANARLDELASLAGSSHVAVLCFEARETECHRHEVLDAVRARLSELVH